MTYTDKHGRHELVMSLAISRGDADYRVVSNPETAGGDADAGVQAKTPSGAKPRREMSSIRAAAAAQLAAERNQQQ